MEAVSLTDAKVLAQKPPKRGQIEIADKHGVSLRLRVSCGGTKTWIVRIRVAGKLKTLSLGRYPEMTLAEARKRSIEVTSAARSGADLKVKEIRRRRHVGGPPHEAYVSGTFSAVADRFLKVYAEANQKRPEQTKWILQHAVYPHWQDRPITEIRRADISRLLSDMVAPPAGSRPRPQLANRTLDVVRRLFRWALNSGEFGLEANPAADFERPAPLSRRDRVLTFGELVRVWRAGEELGGLAASYMKLLILTGQRRGEVASMRWSQVFDLDSGFAEWELSAGETKSSRAHLVPLSTQAADLVNQMPKLSDCDFVFSGTGNGPINGFSKLKARLDRIISICEDGNGPIAPWTLHDLRRSLATGMEVLGIERVVISKILNHSERSVTGRVYARHDYLPQKRAALQAWADHIENVVAGSMDPTVIPFRRERRPGKVA